MLQDATKVLMGATLSTAKEVTCFKGTQAAGKLCFLKSDGTITNAKADGSILGISLGVDLSNAGFVPICRKGLLVPVLLTAAFTPTVGAHVAFSDTTGLAKAYTGTGDSYVNAVYASGKLTGIAEDGSTVDCALIDMVGGL